MKTDVLIWEVSVISSHRHPAVPQVAFPVPVDNAAIPSQSPSQSVMKPHPVWRTSLTFSQNVVSRRRAWVSGLSSTHWSELPVQLLLSGPVERVRTSHFTSVGFRFMLEEVVTILAAQPVPHIIGGGR